MQPIAIAELFSAFYIFISIFTNFEKDDHSKTMKRLKTLSVLSVVWLVADAIAYINVFPKFDSPVYIVIIHVFTCLIYCMSNVIMIAFMQFCASYLGEKTKIPRAVFDIPSLVMIANIAIDCTWYIQGKLVVYKNGMFSQIGTVPDAVLITYIALLFYSPLVAVIKIQEVGIRTVARLSSFAIPTLVSIVILTLTGTDLSVASAAIAIIFVSISVQREIAIKTIEKEAAAQALHENNSRILALEDNFEALYEVDLENGSYTTYVKGDFYNRNVTDKLIEPHNFFDDLRINIERVIYPEDRVGVIENLSEKTILQQLEAKDHFDYYYRLSTDVGPTWMKARAVFKDAQKKSLIIGVFTAMDDFETKQLVEQRDRLEEAFTRAEIANRAKSEFLFNMSHDIRTPMNAIIGFTTLALKYSDDKEKVDDYLNKINTSGKQLLTLVNQALEMARIESGQLELSEKSINIQKEYDSMVTVFSGQAQAKGLTFEHEIKNIKHHSVFADDARMSSITINIVGNAMKYTPEGGKVRFEFEEVAPRRDEYASYLLTVSDTGIGMSEEFQKTMFEPFAREKSTTVSKIQGAGLGMSIVKKLVDFLNGTIEVSSKPGRGTRVSILLDFKINDNPKEDVEERDFHAVSFVGKRVLLVDDNEMNREIVKNVLSDREMIIEEAVDGVEAVSRVKETFDNGKFDYYDVILMDIQMPHMNGYDATREIRALPTPEEVHIPIIAMTANAFEEDRQNAFEVGMDAHLVKPLEVRKMFLTIAEFLR